MFPLKYKCLDWDLLQKGNYSLIPIRFEDRLSIMQWRNDQIDILRQKDFLTQEKQTEYFTNVVSKLFCENKPDQILFSLLLNNELIGYGGLVHINWIDKNAEISFLLSTERNRDKDVFISEWKLFLSMVKEIAFKYLSFNKIYTYAFDLRPHLYTALLESNFVEEACLKDHVFINNSFYNVLIHSLFNERN